MTEFKNILILGSGTVGQATGRGFLERQHKVVFLDISDDLIKRLKGEGLEAHIVGYEKEHPADFIMVCISTPPSEDTGAVNLDYIKEGMKTVGRILSQHFDSWPVVVIRSTVPPGTTKKTLIPLMEKYSGRKAGRHFGVCMNPELLRATSSVNDFAHPWATVIGEMSKRSGNLLEQLYRPFGGKLFRMTLDEAEFLKYTHNLRNAAVISFYNELWQLAKRLGIDPNPLFAATAVTAESAWNPAYGSVGGFPFGGTCLPKDTHALLYFAESLGQEMPLLAAVIKVNEKMQELASQGTIPPAKIEGHKWMPSPSHKKGVSK